MRGRGGLESSCRCVTGMRGRGVLKAAVDVLRK